MAAPPVKVGLDEVDKGAGPLGSFKSRGKELHVEVVGNEPRCVEGLGCRLYQGCGAFDICAGRCRYAAIGEGNALLPTVGEGIHDGAIKVMERQGISVRMCFVAKVIRSAGFVDPSEILVESLYVGIAFCIIISVLGNIEDHLLYAFEPDPVRLQRLEQFSDGEAFLFEDKVVDSMQGIARVDHCGNDGHALGIHFTARFLCQPAFDTTVVQGRAEDAGYDFFMGGCGQVGVPALYAQTGIHLFENSGVKILERSKRGCVSGFWAKLLLCGRIPAVIQSQFHELGQTDGVLACDARTLFRNATGHASKVGHIASVFDCDALFPKMEKIARYGNGCVHKLGLTTAGTYDVDSFHQIGRLHHWGIPEG